MFSNGRAQLSSFKQREHVVDVSPELSVKVLDNRDIVVTMPKTNFEVTYRKDGKSRMLVAAEMLRREDPDPSELRFWVEAWKLAYQTAKARGWL
jgi:hypothetical protein